MGSEPNRDKPILRDEKGLFLIGTAPGPGSPIETEEKKLVRKAIKELVKEYQESLADALPRISPILIAKAIAGDVSAIKELHDRMMGKPPQKTDVSLTIPKPIDDVFKNESL